VYVATRLAEDQPDLNLEIRIHLRCSVNVLSEATHQAMFRATCSFRRISIRPFRSPHVSVISRSLSDDAKQEIVQSLLQAKPVSYVDDVTYSKRAQWEAAIHGSIPLRQRHGPETTYLPAGQHLLYCNTTARTDQLLPDGTDQTLSPPAPWSNRLWAGGRIRFPEPYKVGITESPRLLLVEYVRDVRITGPEGQEKIFVKIERRVARGQTGLSMTIQKKFKHRMKRKKEDDIGLAVIIETRDLCFMRERGSAVPFERRHITPPTNPDYSHSLTPTPALLFRFSALTYNAHAIHIDPEYTRKVYGFPNLLVHGPLSLALMLEYIRQLLMKMYGRDFNIPVVTEINYRNLAPLFANEEMTICIKKKGHGTSVQASSTTLTSTNAGAETTDETPAHSASEDVLIASPESEIFDPEDISPPTAISTGSGHDIGQGFPTPPSGQEDSIPSEQKSEPSTTTTAPEARKALGKTQYPQEWEVWIQTGQSDKASLAVRGTVKIEWLEEPKQDVLQPKQEAPAGPSIKLTKPTQPGITEQEKGLLPIVQALLKTQALLKKQQGRTGGPPASQKKPKKTKDKHQSPFPAVTTPPANPMTEPQSSAPMVRRVEGETRRPVRMVLIGAEDIPLIRRIDPFTETITLSKASIETDSTPVRSEAASPTTAGRIIRKYMVSEFRQVLTRRKTSQRRTEQANVKRAVDLYKVRRSRSADGIRKIFTDLNMEEDFNMEGFLSHLHSDASPNALIDTSESRDGATGAFERTLRSMLEET
jgi:hydroxyacyl-ACP dehydratase HTD2-like protein with hotdog domain